MTLTQPYNHYNTWAWLYNQTMGPDYCQTQFRPIANFLLPQLSPNAHLLDLCCGTGHLTQKLSQAGYTMTGLDASETMLHYAQQNAPEATLILADARSPNPTLNQQFDAAYSMSASLNHIMELSDLELIFRNLYSMLQDNGIFFFDINHAAQMEKWWCGNPVEGEITRTHAWFLTPYYDPQTCLGYFQITMFQKNAMSSAGLLQPIKNLIYYILSSRLRLLTRLRLKVLTQFQHWQPHWQKSTVRYDVRGHSETEVRQALQSAGFQAITSHTIDGNPTIDNNHSIYFHCQK